MKIKYGMNGTTLQEVNGHKRRVPIMHRKLFHPNGHTEAERIGRQIDALKRRRRTDQMHLNDLFEEIADGLITDQGFTATDQSDDVDWEPQPAPEDLDDDEAEDGEPADSLFELQLSESDRLERLRARRGIRHYADEECPNNCGLLDPDGSCDGCGYAANHPQDAFDVSGLTVRTLRRLHASVR